MWTKPAATEMRFGFEVTMYVMNKYFRYCSSAFLKFEIKKGTNMVPFFLS